MIKTIPLKVFPLTRTNDTVYNLLEFKVLLENLSKYKYSGYIEIEGEKTSFIVLIDEGMAVSYVDTTNDPIEIAPILFQYRLEEQFKATTYIMPAGFSSILRGFHLFENIFMNYNILNIKDWNAFLTKISQKNITGILQMNILDKEYFLLIKSGNIYLRSEVININSLVISQFFFEQIVIEKIKNNNKGIFNVIGIENKELTEKLKEYDLRHSLVKELEVKENKSILGAKDIVIPADIVREWEEKIQDRFSLQIEGIEGKINLSAKADPKLSPDTILIPSSIMQKIKIRDQKIMPGERIVIYPQIL